jgi:antitoxin (DNA-binding transcriptional repressor) of toxin-antitoxin stability system
LQQVKDKGLKTMHTVTLEEAQAKLPEVINKLAPGEEVIITRNEQPIAKLVGQQRPRRKPRRPGSAKGKPVVLAEDDEHLKDCKDYME